MQALARTHRDELSQLQTSYASRLCSLATHVRSAQETVMDDELLAMMARDPTSAMHVSERLGEVLEACIGSEQEEQIGLLCKQLAGCEAALNESRREAADARRAAADAAAALPQITATIDEQRELEAVANAARVEVERLTDAISAERRARADAEAQLERAYSTCGSLEVRSATVETELAAARRDAAAAIEAAEARVRAMGAAAAALKEGHIGAAATSAAWLRETSAAAAKTDGERVSQVT